MHINDARTVSAVSAWFLFFFLFLFFLPTRISDLTMLKSKAVGLGRQNKWKAAGIFHNYCRKRISSAISEKKKKSMNTPKLIWVFSLAVAALAFPSTGLALLLCLNKTNARLKGGKAREDDIGEEAAPAGRKINGRERLPYTEMAQQEERGFIYFFFFFFYTML